MAMSEGNNQSTIIGNHSSRRWKPRISHLLIGLLVLGIAWFALFRVRLRSKVQAKLEAVRAAGHPVTYAELDAWYSIPENAKNAADGILLAGSYVQEWPNAQLRELPIVGEGKLPARTEPVAEATRSLMTAYVDNNQKALELLYEAASVEHCRYPLDIGKGSRTLMRHVPEIRKCGDLLQLQAVLAAETGRLDLAERSIAAILGLARSLRNEPATISQLARIGCRGFAVSVLERVINRIDLTEARLVNLSRVLTRAERSPAMSTGFVGSRCYVIDFFTAPTPEKLRVVDRHPPFAVVEFCKFVGVLDRDLLIYLELMEGYLRVSALALHERIDAARKLDRRLISELRFNDYAPVQARMIEMEVKSIARLQASVVALAVQRYRLPAGRLPDSLAELVPKYLDTVPKDPFDGDDMRYQKLTKGFVVYSVGEDMLDDGGKEQPPRTKGRRKRGNHDITFIVER